MTAEIVVMADCASNYGNFDVPSSSGKSEYKVSFSGSEGPAFCECISWKFSKGDAKDCKHIRFVYERACMYNPQWKEGKENPEIRPVSYSYHEFLEQRCPACGGPTVAVKRAV